MKESATVFLVFFRGSCHVPYGPALTHYVNIATASHSATRVPCFNFCIRSFNETAILNTFYSYSITSYVLLHNYVW